MINYLNFFNSILNGLISSSFFTNLLVLVCLVIVIRIVIHFVYSKI